MGTSFSTPLSLCPSECQASSGVGCGKSENHWGARYFLKIEWGDQFFLDFHWGEGNFRHFLRRREASSAIFGAIHYAKKGTKLQNR